MKLIAVLCWFDESPNFLAATVASVARCCDHVVAVDGAYADFPGGQPTSGWKQVEAIVGTASAAGIGCTIERPQKVWASEVQKRTFSFQRAYDIAEFFCDWLLVIDADEVVTEVPGDLKERLERCQDSVGAVTLWWSDDPAPDEARAQLRQRFLLEPGGQHIDRRLLLALPDLRVEVRHDRWAALHELYLRGDDAPLPLDPAADFTDLRIEHRHIYRDLWRRKQQFDYYERRDSLGLEVPA